MTGFKVDIAAVGKIGDQQERLAEDARLGKLFVARNTYITAGQGMMNVIQGGHDEVLRRTNEFLETLHSQVAKPAEAAFKDAAKRYDSYDKGAAAKLDSMYPRTDTTEAKKGLDPLDAAAAPFADLREPAAHYVDPQDYNSDFPYQPKITDVLSPASLFRDLFWSVTALATHFGMLARPLDPFEGVVKVVSGDWAALRACADVFHDVGSAADDMARNVQWAAQRLEGFWTGNAADSAQLYLLELARSLDSATDPFKELSEQYKLAAQGANEVGEVVGGLLCDAIDAMVVLVTGLEAAGMAAGTVVGIPAAVVIAEATAMYELMKVVQFVIRILDLLDMLQRLLEMLDMAMGTFGVVLVPDNMPKLESSRPMYLPR